MAKTIESLDILAAKRTNVYPPNIREWARMILETGNKANETLIDIHKKFYASLKDCFSLNEAKARFPEFREVKSDSEVEFKEGTIFDKVKKGELEYFDSEEDLSLQLLKLYWGEGFSFNDLKKYTDGADLYYMVKKLGIPSVDPHYGYYLKFSDKDYNARLTREMTEKRMLAMDKKAQEQDGEPVYIRRGALSEEHKRHISEGLKAFYEKNPERIYEMSERQKEFYKNNPSASDELSRVLEIAWNIFSAKNIKKALSEFMKKHGVLGFDPQAAPINISKVQSELMKSFWGQNPWARKAFSNNMTFAWKKVKQQNEMQFTVRTIPLRLTKYLAEKSGYPVETLNFDTICNPYLGKYTVDPKAQFFWNRYAKDIEGISDVMADTYQQAVLRIFLALKEQKRLNKGRGVDEIRTLVKKLLDANFVLKDLPDQTTAIRSKSRDLQDVQNDYVDVAVCAAKSGNPKLTEIVNKALDDAFEFSLEHHRKLGKFKDNI